MRSKIESPTSLKKNDLNIHLVKISQNEGNNLISKPEIYDDILDPHPPIVEKISNQELELRKVVI